MTARKTSGDADDISDQALLRLYRALSVRDLKMLLRGFTADWQHDSAAGLAERRMELLKLVLQERQEQAAWNLR